MNKQIKKKLELELAAAVTGILHKKNAKAAGHSKKVIRQSVKSVVKKFSKALKTVSKKKKPQGKASEKKPKKKIISKAKVVYRTPRVKRSSKPVSTEAPVSPGFQAEGLQPQNS